MHRKIKCQGSDLSLRGRAKQPHARALHPSVRLSRCVRLRQTNASILGSSARCPPAESKRAPQLRTRHLCLFIRKARVCVQAALRRAAGGGGLRLPDCQPCLSLTQLTLVGAGKIRKSMGSTRLECTAGRGWSESRGVQLLQHLQEDSHHRHGSDTASTRRTWRAGS